MHGGVFWGTGPWCPLRLEIYIYINKPLHTSHDFARLNSLRDPSDILDMPLFSNLAWVMKWRHET